ncbi:MAG: hypothetical protein J6L62_09390 [Clostridia bacterium]|nr:hypothetical protein [Clostridia bacterium]
MSGNGLQDFEYTQAAWESMYDAVDDSVFFDKDAELIYESLQNKMKFISFGDYLKRYLYLKAGLTVPFSDVTVKDYQLIIKSEFEKNQTPQSFVPTTAKLSALSKNWLTQNTVKRIVVFLLGFGLDMSVTDVNQFLTKALREHEINPKNPFEVICWYCYKNKYGFQKFRQLWDTYRIAQANALDSGLTYSEYAFGERTISVRDSMYTIEDDNVLIEYLLKFKTSDNRSRLSVTSRYYFQRMYDEARGLIADLYNANEEENHRRAYYEYKDRLSRNDRLYDYEKIERLKKFNESKKVYTRYDISESDIEQIICAAIPKDRHGNLTPSKASKLNEQFAGKRFSRQRISEILSGSSEVNRVDLITLNFFIFSQRASEYSNATRRYSEFLKSTNEILEKCFMGTLYVQNPYECFLLMCILSVDPLATFANVWELSYEK